MCSMMQAERSEMRRMRNSVRENKNRMNLNETAFNKENFLITKICETIWDFFAKLCIHV